MGLDMRPMGRPKPGFEKRFEELFHLIKRREERMGLFDRLRGRKPVNREDLLREWREIQIPAYETIKAPRVGRDEEADTWAKERFKKAGQGLSEQEFLKRNEGYYVIKLAKELDGVAYYGSLGQDENVFRGQFLADCIELIGEDLVGEAWETKLAADALDYGNRLMDVAERIAREHGLEYLRGHRVLPELEKKTINSQLHVLYSLAKWLIFYGRNGHGYEADY